MQWSIDSAYEAIITLLIDGIVPATPQVPCFQFHTFGRLMFFIMDKIALSSGIDKKFLHDGNSALKGRI